MDIVKLGIEVDSRKVKTATKDLDRLEKEASSADKTTTKLKRTFLALGVAVPVAAFVAATKGSLDYADGIADAAEKTAFTTKSLQELRFAAEQNGIAISELEGGLARFTKRLGLARRGTGAAAKEYKELGIDLSKTNREVFQVVVEILGNMKSETDRLALATRFFGDDAQRLGVLFKDGNRGLKQYAERAQELGLILSDDLVQGASDANDQLSIMKQVLSVQFTRVFVELAPIITEVGQAFADAAPKIAAFFGSFGEIDTQSKGALEATISNIRSQTKELQDLRRRIIEDDPNTIESILGFPKTEAEVNAEIDALFSKFVAATKRLEELKKKISEGGDVAGLDIDISGMLGVTNEATSAIENARKSLQGLASDMQMQVSTFGQSDAAVLKYRLTLGDLSEQVRALGPEGERLAQSIVRQAEALEKAKIAEEVEKSFRDLTASLEEQSEAIGMTERELYIYEATTRLSANATDDMRDSVRQLAGALYDEKQALEAAQQQRQRANEITQEVMTPLEQYQAAISELDTLLLEDAITHETWERAANKAWTDTVGKVKQSTDDISEFTKAAAESMQSAMSDFFFDFMQGNLDDLGDSFKRTIDRMVADALAAELGNALFGNTAKGGSGSGGLLSGAMDFVGSLLSFDGGGNTGSGPRTGGVDGKGGFPAVLHPNETVIDHTKGQSAGGVVVSINVNGVRDEGGLKRTAAQIAQQSGIAAQRAMARNG